MDETILQLLSYLAAAQPNYNRDGVPENDLDYQNKVGTFLNKQNDILADPITLALSGLGAYDPAAFAPVEDQVVERELPQRPTLDAYLQSNPSSVEYGIAEAIASGNTPEMVVATIRQEGGLDPADLDAEKRVRDLATNLFQENAQYQSEYAKIPKDEQGNPILRESTSKDSVAAEPFRRAGLPLPTDSFRASDYADVDGTRAQAEALRPNLDSTAQALEAIKRQLSAAQTQGYGAARRADQGRSFSTPQSGSLTTEGTQRGIESPQGLVVPPVGSPLRPPGEDYMALDALRGLGFDTVIAPQQQAPVAAPEGPVSMGQRAGGRGFFDVLNVAKLPQQVATEVGTRRSGQAQAQQGVDVRKLALQRTAAESAARLARSQYYTANRGAAEADAYGQARAQTAAAAGDTPLRRALLERLMRMRSAGA